MEFAFSVIVSVFVVILMFAGAIVGIGLVFGY